MTKKKNTKDLLKVGKPSTFNLQLGEKICHAVATTTDGLNKICEQNPEFPTEKCVNEWRFKFPEFGRSYALAKAKQADLLAEEISEISKNRTNDFYVDEEGNRKPNPVNVQRDRLIIDTQKWIACKLLPKVYGDYKAKEEADDILKQTKDALEEIRGIAKRCMKEI